MKPDLKFSNIEDFINALKEHGIHKAAFTLIDEKRAFEKAEREIEVLPLKRLEVLAYKDAVIFRYIQEGDVSFEKAYERLEREGFELVKRSRNIL